MTIEELTFGEIANCRIVAKKEEYTKNVTVTWEQVAHREIAKALKGEPSLVALKDLDESTDNIGKYIYLEFANGDCRRVFLVDSSDEVNPDANVISTSSPVGKHLKFAKVGELIQVNDTILRVVDITRKHLSLTN
jgi:hypothetical protein